MGSGIEDGIWRLCKTYGRLIGVPELKPHDLRHGVAMEVLQQHHDLEQVRALLGHTRVDTTQIYATIRPVQLKRAVAFYEDEAERLLSVEAVHSAPKVSRTVAPGSRNIRMFLKPGS
jgi:integrase